MVLDGLSNTCWDHKHHASLPDEALQVAKYIYPLQERHEIEEGQCSIPPWGEGKKNQTEAAEKKKSAVLSVQSDSPFKM